MIISTSFEHTTNTLVSSYYDKEGKITYISKPVPESELFNWSTSLNPSEFRNWDEKFLKKHYTTYLSKFRLEELTQQLLSKADIDLLYSDYSPRRYFLDIEIKLIDNTFPDPELAEREVNLITFVNDDNAVFVMSTMEEFDSQTISKLTNEVNEYLEVGNQKFTIQYLYFKEEYDMLTMFFTKVLPKIPFLTGWNVIKFDWLYLVNRAKNLNIEPLKSMRYSKMIGRGKLPTHMGLLDYMEVFMNTKPYKVVENYKLDYIAELVLGVTKLKTEYNTMLDAQTDAFNFVKYNIVDTCLVKLIDDKLGLLEVAFAISKIAKIDVSKVFSAVHITETLMCREFLNRNRFLAYNNKGLVDAETYDGAYVMQPKPGFYKYIMLRDFSSMYPNLTIQFNISPDAYLGKMTNNNIPHDVIYTKNDTLFSNKFDSVARVILSNLYQSRVDMRTQMAKLDNELENI